MPMYSKLMRVLDELEPETRLAINKIRSLFSGRGVGEEEMRDTGFLDFAAGRKSATPDEIRRAVRVPELEERDLGTARGYVQEMERGPQDTEVNPRYFIRSTTPPTQNPISFSPDRWQDDLLAVATADRPGPLIAHGDSLDLEDFSRLTGASAGRRFMFYKDEDSFQRALANLREHRPEMMLPGGDTEYAQYKIPGGLDYQEHLLRDADPSYHYTAPHYTGSRSSNLLAHSRTTTRTHGKEPGKTVHFIEEIQSDLHQRLKKLKEDPNYSADRKAMETELADLEKKWAALPSERDMLDEQDADAYDAFINERENIFGRMQVLKYRLKESLDKAPFHEAWPAVAVKRELQRAVDNNADFLGWTTGDTQNDRYKLTSVVDELSYNPFAYLLEGKKDGRSVTMPPAVHQAARGGRLNEAIGEGPTKALEAQMEEKIPAFFERYGDRLYADIDESGAQRWYISDPEGRQLTTEPDDPGRADPFAAIGLDAENFYQDTPNVYKLWEEFLPRLKGEELEVGSKGMTSFYDERIPGIIRKVLKELGVKGVSPEIGKISSVARYEDQWLLRLTDEIKQAVREKGLPLWAIPLAVRLAIGNQNASPSPDSGSIS